MNRFHGYVKICLFLLNLYDNKIKKKMRAFQSSFLIIFSAALFLLSCTENKPQTDICQDIDDFVVKARTNSITYTKDDWDNSIAEYEKLLDQYARNQSSYTSEQKEKVANAMGRYHALLIENALAQSADSLKGVLQDFADYAKLLPAYMDGFRDVLQSDTIKLENLFTDIFASDPVKEIIGSIGSLFGGLSGSDGESEIETVVDTLPEAEPVPDEVKKTDN